MRANVPKGMGGGPQNMQAMLRQAQKMQEDMAAKQEDLAMSVLSIWQASLFQTVRRRPP